MVTTTKLRTLRFGLAGAAWLTCAKLHNCSQQNGPGAPRPRPVLIKRYSGVFPLRAWKTCQPSQREG